MLRLPPDGRRRQGIERMEERMITDTQLERRAAVLEAVEYGKYRQGFNFLNTNGQMCFRGVLCDMSGLGSWTDPGEDGIAGFVLDGETHEYRNYAPGEVADWYGMDDEDEDSFVSHNDEGEPLHELVEAFARDIHIDTCECERCY